jgi:regulator of nonsense transcripts 1
LLHRNPEPARGATFVAEACLLPAPAGTRWRLDQGFSSATAERQLAAIARLGRRHDPACRGEAAVQAVLLGGSQARLERIAAQPTAWAQDAGWRADAREQLAAATSRLNPSQAAAVTKAMTRTFTLWQGPPGTGKTRTLLAYVEAMVRTAAACPLRRRAQGPLLAAADTNAAADNLLEGLLARGIAAVGAGERCVCVGGVGQGCRGGASSCPARPPSWCLLASRGLGQPPRACLAQREPSTSQPTW